MSRTNEPPIHYRHKTVSIPQEAYDRLFELREKVARGAVLPERARAFLDQQQAGSAQKHTFGLVFWLACEMAIAQLDSNE